ncbi:cytochrome P450 [Streptomyces sp. TRM68367]|uniref:cytochrome P450 n=1 Tax=Streptomyces sp. TRM68367 TaxID=2758415 RepID=UPI00165AC90C|nr:cytochrome P450 [Streptomyces sp. TRM68367]MBC9728208.1 cytochrome P450 [Streptomyces sp. TRM68367]
MIAQAALRNEPEPPVQGERGLVVGVDPHLALVAAPRRWASAFSLLAQHPEAERRLHAEVDDMLAGRQRLSHDDLPRLVYTRAVINETLRHSARRCTRRPT